MIYTHTHTHTHTYNIHLFIYTTFIFKLLFLLGDKPPKKKQKNSHPAASPPIPSPKSPSSPKSSSTTTKTTRATAKKTKPIPKPAAQTAKKPAAQTIKKPVKDTSEYWIPPDVPNVYKDAEHKGLKVVDSLLVSYLILYFNYNSKLDFQLPTSTSDFRLVTFDVQLATFDL